MPHRVEVYDDGQWIVKAEGQKAKALTDALGTALIDLRAVLDRGGEVVTLRSTREDANLVASEGEGRRVVLARVILPPPVP
jgi:hypothetical protein